ncbi:MAG TPA: histidine phosphatase family protein [Candidatus Didemnitutus sp.]|nr:histidine phosphatase family protein [Candidatus Didemnitutus sp.]
MRPSEAFSRLEPAKSRFCLAVGTSLAAVPGMRSVTFTGSFVEKSGLEGISDIDIVVVVDALTAANFAACRAAAAAADLSLLGLATHRLRLNDTFGPLKFDEPGVAVLHLMVYDLAGHREHVLQSPFTCLDWERSPYYFGSSLRQLYPVLGLCPHQFFAARRSLGNYLQDVVAGALSYRRHEFDGNRRSEIVERLPLDRRHHGEYAYHIVRNLVANYAKLRSGANQRWSNAELLEFWRVHLASCHALAGWFSELSDIKQARRHDFPADTAERTRDFLERFSQELTDAWHSRAIRHVFVRHARTPLNDGRFLGQGRNPGIAQAPPPLDSAPELVFCSPARRCQETAGALAPHATVRVDARLHEIDYGRAEGLSFAELRDSHGELVASWERQEDPAFPGGENTAAVAARLRSFLAELPATSSLIVTHNVVLRCLVGILFNLPVYSWHRIPVEHLEQFEILRLDGACYLNLTPAQSAGISDALAGHLT